MTDDVPLAERVRGVPRLARAGVAAVGTALAPIGRRAPEIVVVVGVVLSVLAVLVLVGAARNDAAIRSDQGVAVAEVLDGSDAATTFVRFTAADGAVLTPSRGVFYPRGLEPGNYVLVEYDRSEPDLVRVAGRDATTGLAPVVLGVVGLWIVLGPPAWLLARRRRTTAAVVTPSGTDAPAARPGTDREADDREPVGAAR